MAASWHEQLYRWSPLALGSGALVALLGALVVRGQSSLAFLSVFVVLFPAALAAALIRWWPGGPEPGAHAAAAPARRRLVLGGAGVLLAAMLTLLLGVAWSGGRLGNMLLVAGVLLLPPAALIAAGGWLLGRRGVLDDELGEDEHIDFRAVEHWGVFLPPAGVLALAALLAAGPFGVLGYSAAGVLYLLVLPATALSAIGAYLNTECALTERHLLIARGVFRRRVERLARERIEACGVHRGWLGRLLGYGRLSVIDREGRSLAIRGIAEPEALRERLD